jgi:DNA polymerase/3'-5' exonuclease PolX
MDYKDLIISELNIILEKEKQNRNTFKVRAYLKVIPQLKDLSSIKSLDDIKNVEGVGKGIYDRIKEIIDTGELKSAEEIKKDSKVDIITEFMNIYGIGPVKANDLYNKQKIHTIEELKEKQDKLLNDKQKIGLKYYEDIKERIPRNEMLKHEKFIKKFVATNMNATIVGSFRREKQDSGDIDVLISYGNEMSDNNAQNNFKKIIENMKNTDYIVDILASGSKKCLAVCKLPLLNSKARRLDLLLTKPEEYPYALLYFTGSDKFNIQMRRKALEKGYSLNEHKLKPLNDKDEVLLNSEKEVFKFLNMDYLEPKDR